MYIDTIQLKTLTNDHFSAFRNMEKHNVSNSKIPGSSRVHFQDGRTKKRKKDQGLSGPQSKFKFFFRDSRISKTAGHPKFAYIQNTKSYIDWSIKC